jgi:glycosyltransferase involved in cell wall biosynthesis
MSSPLRLTMDGIPLLFRRAGIGRYTYELVTHFAGGPSPVSVRLANVGWSLPRTRVPALAPGDWLDRMIPRYRYHAVAFNLIPRPIKRRVLAAQVSAGSDVYFGTNFLGVFHRAFPTVLTVHDMAYHIYPEHALPSMRRALDQHLPGHVQRAARVIADSEATKRDIVRILGTPADKVAVVPLATNPSFRPVADPARLSAVRARHRLPARYLLYVGTIEPRKNLCTLFDAMAQLPADIPLVVVGGRGWNAGAVFARLDDLVARGRALYLGYVAEADLPAVYSMASLFVFPSHYEGFGIPPLEAMACGVPVVTTNVSSLPEVVGDAGILVTPNHVDELAAAANRVLSDEDLAARMRVAGLARAATFSWQATAERTLHELQSAVASWR